jgi:hypothetical protein
MVHYNCLDSLTAGLKQIPPFALLHKFIMICMMGFWAGSVALPGSLSCLTRVLSTLPIPHGWALVPVPVTGTASRTIGGQSTPSKRQVLEHFMMVRNGKGSQFMHVLRNALHLTLQARRHHCPGCHFELELLFGSSG